LRFGCIGFLSQKIWIYGNGDFGTILSSVLMLPKKLDDFLRLAHLKFLKTTSIITYSTSTGIVVGHPSFPSIGAPFDTL
jgi:hypothetical protein